MTAFQYTSYSQNIASQLMKDFPNWINEQEERFHPDAKIVGPGLFTHIGPLREQYSNVKMQFAGTKNGNFYIREKDSDSVTFLIEPDNGKYWSMETQCGLLMVNS